MVEIILDPGRNDHPGLELHAVRITNDMADDARRYVPVDTGELRESISEDPNPRGGRVWVGTDHWAPVEYGSRAHVIRPVRRDALYWPGASHPVAEVHHPGTPEQPFMRPALYQGRS